MSLLPIDVRDLAGRPGASREVDVRGSIEGLDTELAGLRGPVSAALRLEWVVDGVLASGRIEGDVALLCARCLTMFDRAFEVGVRELFVVDPSAYPDAYPMDAEGRLDPDQMVRDAIGVELPFAPLCRPDCLGLCEVCGADRNRGECPGHERVDPRWEGLEAVLAILDD